MLRNREYVLAVYQEKSFSKAAQKLFVSQPALSAAIKKIEAKIGHPIFNRSKTPLELTPAGEYYIQSVEKIAEIERDMIRYFHALSGKQEGHLNIGGAAFFCAYILPTIAQEFQERYPGYSVDLMESDAAQLVYRLQTGDIDFCFAIETLSPEIFESRVVATEHIVLAVPSAFGINDSLREYRLTFEDVRDGRYLSSLFPSVNIGAFRAEPFLFLKKGNDSYNRGMKLCKAADFVPHVAVYLDQLLTSYYVACDGKGVAFIRASLTRYVESTDKLFFYKIDDPLSLRNITLYHKKAAEPPTAAARDFLLFIENKLQSGSLF